MKRIMIFSEDTQRLLAQANAIYPGSIILRASGENTGVINNEQVQTEMLGSRMVLEVTDMTAPDYTATHELLHMVLSLNGFPQVFFQLETEDEALTEQMMVMGTYLYQPAANIIVYREQAKHGLLTEEVVAAYAKGVLAQLTKEDGTRSESALRFLTLLDANIFMSSVDMDTSKYTDTFNDMYPEAWEAAQALFVEMNVSQVQDPATMHHAIMDVFAGFDRQMNTWGLPELNAKEFCTVTPVLSERQMRLKVSQVFEIKHVPYVNRTTKSAAFVGLGKKDKQNSFVLAVPVDATPEFFKEMYDLTVQELFDQLQQPFTLRS